MKLVLDKCPVNQMITYMGNKNGTLPSMQISWITAGILESLPHQGQVNTEERRWGINATDFNAQISLQN